MTLSTFTQTIVAAIQSSKAAAAQARLIQSSAGDLPLAQIRSLFTAIETAEAAWRIAKADAANAKSNALNSYIASIGGTNVNHLLSDLNAVTAAKNALGDGFETFMQGLSADVFVSVPTLTDGVGNQYRELQLGGFISDPQAQQLRDSAALANLVSAYDVLGVV